MINRSAVQEFAEKSGGQITATLVDETGTVVALASLATITMTLYDVETGAIVNSRSAQNVLNANNVTIHATSGLLTWQVQPADVPIVGVTEIDGSESHIALLEWTVSGGVAGKYEIVIRVRNLSHVS